MWTTNTNPLARPGFYLGPKTPTPKNPVPKNPAPSANAQAEVVNVNPRKKPKEDVNPRKNPKEDENLREKPKDVAEENANFKT